MSSSGSSGGETATGKGKTKVSPLRNVVGLALLVLFGGTAIVEFMAGRSYTNVVNALETRLPKETDPFTKVAERPTRGQAEKRIGKGPDGPLVKAGPEQRTTYSWRGLIRKYSITAFYTDEEKPNLIRIETAQ